MEKVMLTTIDNPFNPFEDFDSWFNFDMDKGYNTCAYLARIAYTSDSLSDAENDRAIEDAIDDIILYDFMNIYKKVRFDDDDDTSTFIENPKDPVMKKVS